MKHIMRETLSELKEEEYADNFTTGWSSKYCKRWLITNQKRRNRLTKQFRIKPKPLYFVYTECVRLQKYLI